MEEEYKNEEYEEENEIEKLELLNEENELTKNIAKDLNKQISAINKFSEFADFLPESITEELNKQGKILNELTSIINREDIDEEEIEEILERQNKAIKEPSSKMNEENFMSGYEGAVIRLETEIKCFSFEYNIETDFLDIPIGVDFSEFDIPEEIKPYIGRGEYQSVYAFNIPLSLKPYFEEYIRMTETAGDFKLKENGYIVKLTYSYEDEPNKIYVADIIEPESREITDRFTEEEKEKLEDNPYIDYDFIVGDKEED